MNCKNLVNSVDALGVLRFVAELSPLAQQERARTSVTRRRRGRDAGLAGANAAESMRREFGALLDGDGALHVGRVEIALEDDLAGLGRGFPFQGGGLTAGHELRV